MVDTHRMHRLLQAAGPAIIRTLGDPEQAQPVGPGGWHAAVGQAIGGHAELATVLRQRDPADRQVCRLIRQGDADHALAILWERGRIHLTQHASAAVKELVPAWERHRSDRGMEAVKVVTDTSNATIDTLNGLCQQRRLRSGELSGPSVELVDRAAGPRERVHVGDRVSFIRPYRADDGRRVANGTAGTVLDLDAGRERLAIGCDDGHVIMVGLPGREWAQPLRLGYAGMHSACRETKQPWSWSCRGRGRPPGSPPTRCSPAASTKSMCSSTATASASASTPPSIHCPRSRSAGHATHVRSPPPLSIWPTPTSSLISPAGPSVRPRARRRIAWHPSRHRWRALCERCRRMIRARAWLWTCRQQAFATASSRRRWLSRWR